MYRPATIEPRWTDQIKFAQAMTGLNNIGQKGISKPSATALMHVRPKAKIYNNVVLHL
jgi:hypothetical protein